MSNQSGEIILIKNNGAFNPEMRYAISSDEFPNDRTLDIGIDITGFTIKMYVRTSDGELIESFSTADGSITITNATGGYWQPLQADISTWSEQVAEFDIVYNDVLGDGLNDATKTGYFDIRQGVTYD